MYTLGASRNRFGFFSRQNCCCSRIGFLSNQIRSYIHALKDIQLVANRYFIGYFGQLGSLPVSSDSGVSSDTSAFHS